MSAFASHRDNPIVEGVPMRFTVSDNGVPGKTGGCGRKTGGTGNLTPDNIFEADCRGPAGLTCGFGIWISVRQSYFGG